MATATARKVARRDGLKKYLEEVLGKISDALEDEESTQAKLVGLKSMLVKSIQQITSLDDEILGVLEPSEVEADVSESMRVLEPTYEAIATLDLRLEKIRITSVVKVSGSTGSTTSSSMNCKLPKFELPNFRGDPLQWQGFWDQFNVSIHSNEVLSDIDRFNYLKRYLKDEALSAVSGLTLCSQNYDEAVTILRDRYGNEQTLISAHMTSLLKMVKIRKQDDVKGLRKLYDGIESCVRNLKALKLDTVGYGSLLIPILKERLPDEMIKIISREFKGNVWTLDELLKFFHDELRVLENCVPMSKQIDSLPVSNDFTASGLFAGNEESGRQRCVYCDREGHVPSRCRIVTNVKSRREILKKFSKCFVCLGEGHRASECGTSFRCRKCDGRKHHISICSGERQKTDRFGKKGNESNVATSHENRSCSRNGILLQTAKSEISSVRGDTKEVTRILFDGGSQRTYINESLCKTLKLKTIRKERIVINTFGRKNSSLQFLNVVQFRVKHKMKDLFVFVEALSIPSICRPLTNQDITFAKINFSHISSLDLADANNDLLDLPIGVLVGVDFYHSFFSGQVIRDSSGPVALESVVGWVLSGPLNSSKSESSSHCFEVHTMTSSLKCESDDQLRHDLKMFWAVEEVGAEDCVVSRFEKDIVHDGTRYVTKLPLKPDHEPIPDNFDVCKGRLKSLKKRLLRQGIYDDYDQIFVDYEKEGIIERVPEEEVAKDTGKVHYLPHRPVIRSDKTTTKIRAVFDASCGVNGPSLNDCLYSGPNLIAKIFDILTRFRLNSIAIISDIKQAFLNVGIAPEHTDLLRFRWFDGDNMIVFRFLRVVFGLTSSPFLLNGTIRHHLGKHVLLDSDFVKKFIEDLYVDDETSGCSSVQEGKVFYEKASHIMSEAGFCLRKWVTNNDELQAYFDKCMTAKTDCKENGDDISFLDAQMNIPTDDTKRVLGIEWDVSTDEFVFRFCSFIEKCKSMALTKRNILSVAASIYDPIGFVSPITARVKTIFQILCRDKHDWDEDVPIEVRHIWNTFVDTLERLKLVRVPRFAFTQPKEIVKRTELHGFCDSSNNVYCGIVYLRLVTDLGVKVFFLSSKSRVAPLKELTIPRLELLGCVLLTKLLKEVVCALEKRIKVDEIGCWTDSEVALCWINGKAKSWKPWVENRVISIREFVPREQWRHIAGEYNPADIPTRSVSDFNEMFEGIWFKGPDFLSSSLLSVSEFDVVRKLGDVDAMIEAKKSKSFSTTPETVVSLALTEHNTHFTKTEDLTKTVTVSLSNIIDSTRFSSLDKLVVTAGYVLRFITNLKKSVKKSDDLCVDTLTLAEYNNALNILIKDEQSILKTQPNFKKLQASLKLFEDTAGLLRLRGRFENADLTHDEKFPVLLRGKNSYLTKLLVRQAHEKVLHHGIETTLACVRSNYWLVKGRQTVKSLLKTCVTCTRYQGRTLRPPPTPDLPDYRVGMSRAFQATGLDFAGPLKVRYSSDTLVAYILLLTCASSRAVHLELVPDLTASSFLRGFRRFTARRGVPDLIVSDNAKTFHAVQVKRYMLQSGVTQRFILPASPWWGGFYERLVRSVKTTLKKVLGKCFLSFEELQTILCDVEIVINTRPLVYQSEDDLDEVLTPSHLMFGLDNTKHERLADVPVGLLKEADFAKRVRYTRILLTNCWKRFSSCYLNELRQAHIYRKSKSVDSRKLTIGDVVLIRDDIPLPRHQWRMGKVVELIRGKDSNIRGAKLTVISKKGFRTTAHRPVQKLIPFEIVDEPNEVAGEAEPNEVVVEAEPNDQAEQVTEDKLDKQSEKCSEYRRTAREKAQLGQYERRLREQYY